MLIARSTNYVSLSDIPNVIRQNHDALKIGFTDTNRVKHASYRSENCLFWFQPMKDGHTKIILIHAGHRMEYHSWLNSPYLIRENSLSFWDIDPDERNRLARFISEISELIYAKASQC